MSTCTVCNCRLSGREVTFRFCCLAGLSSRKPRKVERQGFVVKQVLDLKDGDCRMMVSKPLIHGDPSMHCRARTTCVCAKG